jgi:hypothetical protein
MEPKRTPWWRWLLLLLILLPLNWAISTAVLGPAKPTDVSYSFFRAQVDAGNVSDVTAVEDEITGTLKQR